MAKGVFEIFGKKVTERAQRNLGATQPRFGVKANWKDGKPSAFKRHQFRSRIVASGTLKSNIDYNARDDGVTFTMPDYGEYVNYGRRGKKDMFGIGANPSAKAPPKGTIDKWVLERNIKPRDKDGRFVKVTVGRLRSLSYLINRKIKWFGIAPSHFFTDAVADTLVEMGDDIPDEIIEDLFKKK